MQVLLLGVASLLINLLENQFHFQSECIDGKANVDVTSVTRTSCTASRFLSSSIANGCRHFDLLLVSLGSRSPLESLQTPVPVCTSLTVVDSSTGANLCSTLGGTE